MAIPFSNGRLLVLFAGGIYFKCVSRMALGMIFAYPLGRSYNSLMRTVLHEITIKLFLK